MKIILLFFLSIFSIVAFSQNEVGSFLKKIDLPQAKIVKTGPYIGVQRGKYTIIELGAERQWKRIKLKAPKTHALHVGFNYNFKYNVLGYDVGYWIKPHRVGLTYGANLFYRTDFTSTRLGFAPVVGFKFMWFHLQTGYHFMSRPKSVFETNKFFISLRVGIINDRDVKFKR